MNSQWKQHFLTAPWIRLLITKNLKKENKSLDVGKKKKINSSVTVMLCYLDYKQLQVGAVRNGCNDGPRHYRWNHLLATGSVKKGTISNQFSFEILQSFESKAVELLWRPSSEELAASGRINKAKVHLCDLFVSTLEILAEILTPKVGKIYIHWYVFVSGPLWRYMIKYIPLNR